MKPILTVGKDDLKAAIRCRDASLAALRSANPEGMGYRGERMMMRQWAKSWRQIQYRTRVYRAGLAH